MKILSTAVAALALAGAASGLDLNTAKAWEVNSWAKLTQLGEETMTDFVDEGTCVTLRFPEEPKPRAACNVSTRTWLTLEPKTRYRISCWVDVDREGPFTFGVDSWHGKYKRHYYAGKGFGAVPGWHRYEWTLETPSAEEYPVMETRKTRGTIGFSPCKGVRRLRVRDWKLERVGK